MPGPLPIIGAYATGSTLGNYISKRIKDKDKDKKESLKDFVNRRERMKKKTSAAQRFKNKYGTSRYGN